jgi:hypothetical protein
MCGFYKTKCYVCMCLVVLLQKHISEIKNYNGGRLCSEIGDGDEGYINPNTGNSCAPGYRNTNFENSKSLCSCGMSWERRRRRTGYINSLTGTNFLSTTTLQFFFPFSITYGQTYMCFSVRPSVFSTSQH